MTALFYDSLNSPEAGVRIAALAGLGTRPVLERPFDVWHRVESNNSSRTERIQALLTLERTGAVSVDRIKEQLLTFDPLERHFAARCLLSKKDRVGAEVLLDLVALPRQERLDPDTRWSLVARLTQTLLSQLSGTTNDERWRAWLDEDFAVEAPASEPQVPHLGAVARRCSLSARC